ARSASLEAAFAPQRRRMRAAQRNGATTMSGLPKKQTAAARHKKATSPQLWLTLLWHVGSGLPWAWRTGPSGASEREHLVGLVPGQDGKQALYVVTDLPKPCLSDRQVATIYGARWGVEVFFRTFKQTFGRRKLRSRSALNAQLELEWSLLGLWGVCLLGTREL